MKLLVLFLSRYRNERRLAALVRSLSDSCQAEVWNRVREQVFGMGLAEARGYVRARAIAPIRERAAAVLEQFALSAEARCRVILGATERVVQRILCELIAGSPIARRMAA